MCRKDRFLLGARESLEGVGEGRAAGAARAEGTGAELARLEADRLDGHVEHLLGLLHVAALLRGFVVERLGAVGVVPVVFPELVAATLPGPVGTRLGVLLLAHHGREAAAGLLHGDVSLGDVLLDEGEEEAEGGGVVAEQRRVGDAAGVHGGERDSGLFVPPVGHLLDGEDVAQLGVLVRLGSDEAIAVDHGVLIAVAVEPRGEAAHGAEVGARGHLAGEGVGVGGDRADDAEALVDAHVLGADEVLEHEVGEEEVAEVGDADGLLEAVLGEGGGDRVGVVDGGVAHERLELLGVLLAAELLDEGADVGEVAELELHDLVLIGGEAELLGLLLALGDVAAGHDDEVVAALDESLGGVEAEAGGCARHDGGLLGARGGHGERSLRLGLNLVAADGDAGDGLAGGDALGLLAEAGHGGSRDGGGEHRCGRHGSLLTPVLVGGLQL
mmetsp:Transcript_4303/g.19581  ORF Transcript_4303/g.19581 Transcript_4303/m.19581 type:complete len:443 (-) Transcript_4303:8-1336(-)